MSDEQCGETLSAEEVDHFVVEAFAGDFIDCAERFVEEENFRVENKAACERGAHLHSARHLGGILVFVAGKPDKFDAFRCSPVHFVCGYSFQLCQQLNIPLDGPPGEESGVLKDVSQARSINRDGARCGFGQARGDSQQCGLATPGGAHDRYELTVVYAERRFHQSVGAIRKGHRDVAEFKRWLSGVSGFVSRRSRCGHVGSH